MLTFAQPVALRTKFRRRAGLGALAATAAIGLLCGALGAGLTIRQRRDGPLTRTCAVIATLRA